MSQVATAQARPWDRPFWKPVRRKEGVFAFLVLIHTLAIIGLILFPLPSLKVFGLAALFVAFGGLGTTVCYHRMLAHKTLKTNRFIEQVLIFWAVFNASGHPASWVAYHRLHHSTTDTPNDISSPAARRLLVGPSSLAVSNAAGRPKRWAPEVNRGVYKIWGYAETPVIILSIFIGPILGLGMDGLLLARRHSPGLHLAHAVLRQQPHPSRSRRRRRRQQKCLVARPLPAHRLGRKLAQESSHPCRLRSSGLALVATRHRLVFHLDARSHGPRPFRQAPARVVNAGRKFIS